MWEADQKVIAIACADIHLSANAPASRAGEGCWFEAMRRPLAEVAELARRYECPVLCAGDVFHHWKAPPELINFAIDHLPPMYAIPGQHDLPFHSAEQIDKSAYATLVRVGKITNVRPKGKWVGCARHNHISRVHGFGWNVPVGEPYEGAEFSIALHHAYRWSGKDDAYTGATVATNLSHTANAYIPYNTVIIGDNHKSWDVKLTGAGGHLFNCGSLMRRASDQENHLPRVGLVLADGRVISYYLNVSKEVFSPTAGSRDDDTMIERLRASKISVEAFAALYGSIDRLDDPAADEMGFYDALRLVLQNRTLGEAARATIRDVLEHNAKA